ncbi:hypothetical protein P43SY_001578 [Pythium insidiosum]|uniref:Uncharacterized protein n=1 Tax=Pythium insidiosum TaxID=114742 RepID=A0AAD5M8G2_PYTIN|nr:hypothetical protein P43SY_001578 [Pythium insidiosum]
MMNSKTLVLAAATAVLATQVQADCADQTIKCVGHGFEEYYNAGFCWSWFSCKPYVNPCDECNNRFGRDRVTGYAGVWDKLDVIAAGDSAALLTLPGLSATNAISLAVAGAGAIDVATTGRVDAGDVNVSVVGDGRIRIDISDNASAGSGPASERGGDRDHRCVHAHSKK